MDKIFAGKLALVTGASYGIGRATALAFADRGADLVLADWKEDPAGTTLKGVEDRGGKAMFVSCDVSVPAQVEALVRQAIDRFGRLDFAFNNAGVEGEMGKVHECSEANWDRTIGINLKGVWNCMKYEIPEMLKQPGGVIVNCASVAGLKGFAGLPAYTASKHAVVGLSRSAALEYAASGLRVVAVCPGVVRTAMIDRVTGGDPEKEKQYTAMEPLGRMGTPEEIAELVVWLCTPGASFVTGAAIPVDGGLLA